MTVSQAPVLVALSSRWLSTLDGAVRPQGVQCRWCFSYPILLPFLRI